MRSGTLNVPAIGGLGEATMIASKQMDSENVTLKRQATAMFDLFEEQLDCVLFNGDKNNGPAGNLNVCFPVIEGKAIINSVSQSIAISASSEYTTHSVEQPYVILASGYGEERAHSSVRIWIRRFNNPDETEFAAQKIIEMVKNITKASYTEVK